MHVSTEHPSTWAASDITAGVGERESKEAVIEGAPGVELLRLWADEAPASLLDLCLAPLVLNQLFLAYRLGEERQRRRLWFRESR